MLHTHLTAADVALFTTGRLGSRELRRFLQQAATTCAICHRKLRFYLPPGETSPERHIALWTEERDGLARLQDRQGSAPFDGRYARFRHVARRVHGWARVEHLLELSHELRFRDPKQMLLLAQGAASVANNLGVLPIDRRRYTPALKADLWARAQIGLANAYRLNHDFAHAEACLGAAAELVETGHCAPRTVGQLKAIYAAVLIDQRRLGEAIKLLGNLHSYYKTFGETHLAGRTLVSRGIALSLAEKQLEATNIITRAIQMIDPSRDPKLALIAQLDRLCRLVNCADFQQADQLFRTTTLRQAFADDPLSLTKLRWIESQFLTGIGQLGPAETTLLEVKQECLRHDRRFLVAMVNLDLAGLLSRQGRSAEVRPLAQEALRVFREFRVEREALKAVCLLGAAGG